MENCFFAANRIYETFFSVQNRTKGEWASCQRRKSFPAVVFSLVPSQTLRDRERREVTKRKEIRFQVFRELLQGRHSLSPSSLNPSTLARFSFNISQRAKRSWTRSENFLWKKSDENYAFVLSREKWQPAQSENRNRVKILKLSAIHCRNWRTAVFIIVVMFNSKLLSEISTFSSMCPPSYTHTGEGWKCTKENKIFIVFGTHSSASNTQANSEQVSDEAFISEWMDVLFSWINSESLGYAGGGGSW